MNACTTPVCLYAGLLCLYAGLLCLYAGLLCLYAGLLCLYAGLHVQAIILVTHTYRYSNIATCTCI